MPQLSVFNDVLGPVMVGPSSSHTAGPARLGRWARHLFGRLPERVTITFDPGGSLAYAYQGQRSDRGFAAGLLDMAPDDSRLRDGLTLAREAGLALRFVVAPLTHSDHPNAVALRLEAGGEALEVRGASVGGGMIRISEINDLTVAVAGDAWVVALFGDHGSMPGAGTVEAALTGGGAAPLSVCAGPGLMIAELPVEPGAAALAAVRSLPGVAVGRLIPPVLPVAVRPGVQPLCATAAEMALLGQREGLSLGEIGLRLEMQRSGWPEARALSEMDRILAAMEASVERGLAGGLTLLGGVVTPSSPAVEAWRTAGRSLSGGPVAAAVAGAMAVMENSNAMGTVVAAPTAGSCGVIPGVLRGLGVHLQPSREQLVQGLFAAGAIGLVVARRSTFAAEEAGCQAECGVSSAMAAAALVDIAGGSAAAALEAAAIALENTLGLICDPVACLVEVPCIGRNAMAVGNAFAVADMVMGGYVQGFPFDEVVDAMDAVARQMPSAHRCTGLGGLAATPTGLACAKRVQAQF